MIARYATRVNGITDYFLTKLDVLSSLETVPVCVGYTVDGKRTDEMPMTQSEIARAEPIFEELPGWWEDISGARDFDDLPAKARDYVLAARRACRSSCFVHRRGTRPRADHRATRHPGRPRAMSARAKNRHVTDDPRVVDPDYDRHGGFPNFEPAHPGPGFGRFVDRDASRAGPGGIGRSRHRHLGAGRRPVAEEIVELLDPFEAAEGVGPADRMPELPGAGSLLMPPFPVGRFEPDGVELEVRSAGTRRRQLRRPRRGAAAAVRLGVRHGDPRRGPADQPDRRSCTWTTARSPRSTRR